MSSFRVALRRPHACPECSSTGTILVEQTIKGESVLLNWMCHSCSHRWPVTANEQQPEAERRAGTTDRRHRTRSDRRQKR